MSDSDTAVVEEEPEVEAPPSGDVDVATLSKKRRRGESGPLILAGYWVRLNDDSSVPKEYRGHIAVVLTSPWKNVPYSAFEDQPIAGYTYQKGVKFLVKTRDAADATFEVDSDAFAEVGESRSDVTAHA